MGKSREVDDPREIIQDMIHVLCSLAMQNGGKLEGKLAQKLPGTDWHMNYEKIGDSFVFTCELAKGCEKCAEGHKHDNN